MFVNKRPSGFDKKPYVKREKFKKAGELTGGTTIEVRNGDVTKALRKLKKRMQADNTLQEARDRMHFVKPSEKRRLAKKAGRNRWLKKQREMASEWGFAKKRMY
jgi:ribosomal protein S21